MDRHHFDRDQFASDAAVAAHVKSLTVVAPLPNREALRHQPFTFHMPAGTFADSDPDAVVKYRAHLLGGGALPDWLLFDSTTGTLSGTPPHNAAHDYDIIVRATDGHSSVHDVFHLSVDVHDAAPVAAAVDDQVIGEDAAWSFALPAGTFTDSDSKDLTYKALLANGDALPGWLHFDRLTQTFTGTPPADFNGTLDLAITADDGARTATSLFHLVITPAEDAPRAELQAQDQWVSEDTPFSFSVLPGTFVDPDGDTLTYSATLANGDVLPDWLTFDPTTQTFSGTPPKDFNGALQVKVIADDGHETSSEVFNIGVSAINDAPVVHHHIADAHIVGGDAFTYKLPLHAFTDVDNTDLTYSATLTNGDPLPDWLSFDAATHTFSGTAPIGFDEPFGVTVTASDGASSVSNTFSFSDTAPFAVHAIADQTVGEELAWTFRVPKGTFADFDTPNLAYSATLANGDPLPDWLTFDSATHTFNGVPPEGWSGHEDIKFTASDGTHEASDTFALDQTGDFRYHIAGTTWGKDAPSEIHWRFDQAYFDTTISKSVGFDAGFDGTVVSASIHGNAGFSLSLQAGLLIDFTLKPDTFNLNDTFDVSRTVSNFVPNVAPSVHIVGEQEDTTSFSSQTPDDAFALHAFAGIAGSASVTVGAGADIDILGFSAGGSFSKTFDLPSLPKITIGDGQFTKPDKFAAIDVNIKTGDPLFDIELDSSGIGHLMIGPPPKDDSNGFSIVGNTSNGLGTLEGAGGNAQPFLGVSLDLDKLAIKAIPELGPLFHLAEDFDAGFAEGHFNLDTDIGLTGDLSLEKAIFFTPTLDYTMKTSFGQTITGRAGDPDPVFDTPEGEGSFTVKATYTSSADLETDLILVSTIHLDYTLLKAAFGVTIGTPPGFSNVDVGWDFPAAYSGQLQLINGAIPIFSHVDHYVADQVKNETFTVQYEKFRTAEGSGNTFTFTTHQLTTSASNDADHITGNGLDNIIFGKGGDDTLTGLGGMDTLNGSLGNDHLYGGAGFNSLDGGDGDDFLQSGDDGSTIDAGAGNDIIKTGLGDDTITDTSGAVSITDTGGTNTITLGDESYTLKFLKGSNTLHTGLGNDNITMGGADDHVFAGDGTNVIVMGEGNNSADGGAGNDTITAGSGNDHLDGKGGSDTINGGAGNNTIEDDGGNNHITTGSGDDHFQLGTGKYTVDAGDGANQFAIFGSTSCVLTAGSGNDVFDVRNGTNSITAGAGNDFVNGGIGNDTINGGLGVDLMFSGDGKDTFVYSGATDSSGVNFDHILDFDVKKDHIDLTTAVTGIDKGRSGALAMATFDHDLKQILSAAHLLAGHAVIVTATGALAGDIFLVIDADGAAGYQTGQDYVIRVDGAVSTHFVAGDFI